MMVFFPFPLLFLSAEKYLKSIYAAQGLTSIFSILGSKDWRYLIQYFVTIQYFETIVGCQLTKPSCQHFI